MENETYYPQLTMVLGSCRTNSEVVLGMKGWLGGQSHHRNQTPVPLLETNKNNL